MSPTKPGVPTFVNFRGDEARSLNGMYRGVGCVLVCGGPSVAEMDLSAIAQRGILTAAVNQIAATHIRPHVWITCDPPRNFHASIWKDPAIIKFCKEKYLSDRWQEWNRENKLAWSGHKVKSLPNVWGYHHVHGWNASTFLTQPWPTWGTANKEEDPEGRENKSVMLIALRLLYDLGVRRLYLLGCDFEMKEDRQYAFDEAHVKSGRVSGNNNLFGWLDRRFRELQPHFREHGYEVWNCTVGGKLKAFPRMSLAEAVMRELALSEFPKELKTRGHYR